MQQNIKITKIKSLSSFILLFFFLIILMINCINSSRGRLLISHLLIYHLTNRKQILTDHQEIYCCITAIIYANSVCSINICWFRQRESNKLQTTSNNSFFTYQSNINQKNQY